MINTNILENFLEKVYITEEGFLDAIKDRFRKHDPVVIEKITFVYDTKEMIKILNQVAAFIKKENKKVKHLDFNALKEEIRDMKADKEENWRSSGEGITIATIDLWDECGNSIRENPDLTAPIWDYLYAIVEKANKKFPLRNAQILLDGDWDSWYIYVIAGDQ